MKTISFFNRKGGPGKTSLSFLFARFLAAAAARVLFIDTDPQRTATNHFARLERIKRQEYLDKNIFNVLLDRQGIRDAIIKAGNVSLLASSFDLSEIVASTSAFAIKNILDELQKDYDYCIIDHGPNFSQLNESGLFASDIIVIPTLPDVEGLEQTEWSIKKIARVAPDAKMKIIINQFKGEHPGKLERELLEMFGPVLDGKLLNSSIPATKLIRRYTATGEQINDTAKGKAAFLDKFTEFVNEVTGKKYQVKIF
jgi:chromosome partitioning protein